MQLKEYLRAQLAELKQKNLYRTLKNSPKKYNFSSNNYLGKRNGFGSSRLMSAEQYVYTDLEKAIAKWKKVEAALVFPTGYMANIGTISALMTKGDLIIIDKLVHASIIDGCRLSGADLRVFKHCDSSDLEKILKVSVGKYKKS